jgi:membrane-bound ClpP family serine protease
MEDLAVRASTELVGSYTKVERTLSTLMTSRIYLMRPTTEIGCSSESDQHTSSALNLAQSAWLGLAVAEAIALATTHDARERWRLDMIFDALKTELHR